MSTSKPTGSSASTRPANENDLPFMVTLDRAVERPAWGASGFRDVLSAPYRAWIAEVEGQPAAYLVARVAADEAELLRVAAAPALRRRGLATRLIRNLFKELLADGFRNCHLEVRAGNAGAIAVYERAGFVASGRRRDYYAAEQGREDAILMCRELETGR